MRRSTGRMRRQYLRLGVALLAAGGCTGIAGSRPALASTSLTLLPATVGGTPCHNLQPGYNSLTGQEISPSAFTALADNTRPYTQFSSVTVNANALAIPSSHGAILEAAITVNLCGNVPSFPVTNGDTGVDYHVCFSPDQMEPIVSGRFGAEVAIDPVTGNPIFDGPYPRSQGFKACAWADILAGGGVDYGVDWYDPAQGYTPSHDESQMVDGAFPTISRPTLRTGVPSFTMYLPYTWLWSVNGGPSDIESVLRPGEVATDFAAVASLAVGASTPAPVCDPTTGVCVQRAALPVLIPVDFAPGYELCASVPVVSCAQYWPLGYDLGVGGGPAPPTCLNPVNFEVTCDVATGTGSKGLPYADYFEYGRILGPNVPSFGYSYTPHPEYVANGMYIIA